MRNKKVNDYSGDYWDSGEALIDMGESYTLCQILKVLEGFLRKYPGKVGGENRRFSVQLAGGARECEILEHLTEALSASGKDI